MDRTAWIVVALCVVGLVVWEIYLVKQTPRPRPAPVGVAPGQSSPTITPAILAPSPTPLAEATPSSRESAPSFAEKIETLRNSNLVLHLPTCGVGIRERVL